MTHGSRGTAPVMKWISCAGVSMARRAAPVCLRAPPPLPFTKGNPPRGNLLAVRALGSAAPRACSGDGAWLVKTIPTCFVKEPEGPSERAARSSFFTTC